MFWGGGMGGRGGGMVLVVGCFGLGLDGSWWGQGFAGEGRGGNGEVST